MHERSENRLADRIADRVAARTGWSAGRTSAVGGGSICQAWRVEVRPGTEGDGGPQPAVFAKTLAEAPPDFFAAEAAGLRLLGDTGTVAVPGVLVAEAELLVLNWVEPGPPSAVRAEELGRALAALHSTPAPAYGTPDRPAYLGPLPLSTPEQPVVDPEAWPLFHAEHRLLPFLRLAHDRGAIRERDRRAVEELCARLEEVAGPPQPPAVTHGDLWSGNVLWAADGPARLIDPAAQGGHPETDLAMLELFGCPYLPRVLAAYEELRPVRGRAARVPLHQLQHLLVHAALFGAGYGAQSGEAARAALSAT